MPKKSKPTLHQIEEEQRSGLHPSEFMRDRHPDLFSDSRITKQYHLPQDVFEYHLETLTRRKQELEFEHFARKLAEKEICPNLLPQTGPTGGGDSKVDTETYPVADNIAIRWYEGIGQEASRERWGFAISAKKEWRSKIRSDVAKIIGTDRDYKQIFFITSQYVEDRTRAKVEDELTRKHKVNIRILDRSWIIKCIFENDRIGLAIETLNIPGFSESQKAETGPHDLRRKTELEELEKQIADPDRYQYVEFQLAEDCFQAALLARGLELPRVEIDGRFDRAERIAKRVGHPQQILRIIYNKAWTTFWWFEDVKEFNRLYDRVEELALNSEQARDLELLTNLWNLLFTVVRRNTLSSKDGKITEEPNL
jgi:hypothetical protein